MQDIVIIGAGLAGSGLATTLADRGWDVALLERRHGPHHKVCGEFLSPESQASLRALGLYDAVATLHPSLMTQAHLFSRGGVSVQVALPGVAWGVSRFALDQALAQAAARAGAQVHLGTTVTNIREMDNGYQVNLCDAAGTSSTISCRAVVAACGRHPLPSLRPTDNTPHNRPTYVGVKCHFEGLSMPPEVRLYLFDGGYLGLCPIENGHANACMLVRRETFARAKTVQGMIALAAKLHPTLGRALEGGRALPETEVAVAPVDTGRVATPWEGFARLGDAAVMIPPLCGDGMAMALRAAELCATPAHAFLRGDCTLADWERDYSTAWHGEFDHPVRLGRQLQWLLGMPYVGDALLSLGALLPPLSSRLVRGTRGQLRPLA